MQTTSHFVGLKLDSSKFVDLFIRLQKYINEHELQDSIVLQNILSLHITLYYLDSHLDEYERLRLLQDIAKISSNGLPDISKLKIDYFGEPDKERVCYLGCESNDTLTTINEYFTKQYQYSQIPENKLAFVPHVSLFRIQDSTAYSPHKIEVDKLINKTIIALGYSSLVEGLHLFQVNSIYRPEIQIPVQARAASS